MNNRTLGTIAMLASPALLIELFVFDAAGPAVGWCSLVFAIGWLCTAIGLRRLRATGEGPVARALPVLLIATVSVAVVWAGLVIANFDPDHTTLLMMVTDFCWPFSMLMTLFNGIAIARAGVLAGWRRYVVLASGLALPVSMAVGALLGEAGKFSFGPTTFLGWALMGYMVFTAERTAAPAPYAPAAD